MRRSPAPLTILAALAAGPGCTGFATGSGAPAPGEVVRVAVQPATAQVQVGGTVSFTATVSGTPNPAVTWSVAEGAAGGTVDGGGAYTAPGAPGTFHVVAASVADPFRTGQGTVTVTAAPPSVTVSVTPTAASVDACRTLQLQATVTGTSNPVVTWSVQEGLAGGLVDAAGLYRAPEIDGTYHVVATSAADPTRSGSAAVTVANRILSVTVVPSAASLATGGTAPFSALVTTTCGTFPAN